MTTGGGSTNITGGSAGGCSGGGGVKDTSLALYSQARVRLQQLVQVPQAAFSAAITGAISIRLKVASAVRQVELIIDLSILLWLNLRPS